MGVKISVIMVTRNEERKIRRCLESIRWVNEIVIVDQNSDDATAAICREYTDKVYIVENKGYCEPDRPAALSKTSNEWILYLDADEEVTPRLREEIENKVTVTFSDCHLVFNSYYIPRKNIFLGKWIRGSGWSPGYVLRLFKRDSVRFSTRIHTDLFPVGNCGYLQEQLNHYTCEALEEYLCKLNRYTGILASQAYEKGARITRLNGAIKLFLMPGVYGLKKFILQKGFKDGLYGVLIAFLTKLTIFLMYVKVWEIQRKVVRGK